jgi:hypothetical protein
MQESFNGARDSSLLHIMIVLAVARTLVPGFYVSNLYEAVHVFGCALLAFTALLLIS